MIKIKKDEWDKRIYIHFNDKCFLHFHNDWEQFIPQKGFRWNWYTMNFAHIYFENDKMTGGIDFEFILLGLGFRFRYNYDFEESEAGKRLEEYLKNEK